MGTIGKIALATINLACLIVNLSRPSDATALSIIPVIVTSCVWMVDTIKRRGLTYDKVMYTIIAAISALGCFCVGLTTTIEQPFPDKAYEYIVKFHDAIAFVGGKEFNYAWFALIILIVMIFASFAEICASLNEKKKNETNCSADDIYSAELRGN